MIAWPTSHTELRPVHEDRRNAARMSNLPASPNRNASRPAAFAAGAHDGSLVTRRAAWVGEPAPPGRLVLQRVYRRPTDSGRDTR
jgi:hypothetical protein